MRHCKTPRSRRGFTLIEMLIVVAISIPLVGASLEKARVATDLADERAAKAAGVIYMLTNDEYEWNNNGGGQTLWYDAESGQLVKSTPTTIQQITPYGQSKNNEGKIITVTFGADYSNIQITWQSPPNP